MEELTEKELFHICVELGMIEYELLYYEPPSPVGLIEMVEIKDKNKIKH